MTNTGYDLYATFWRYLGALFDCQSSSSSFLWSFSSLCKYCRRMRKLLSLCKNPTHRLLWAAYHDTYYSGVKIREYEFYDADNGAWDHLM